MSGSTKQKSNRNPSRGLGLIFLLLGLFTLFAGAYYGIESWTLVEDGQEANGRVVDYDQYLDDDQVLNYAPVIQYQVEGQPYRFISANYKYSLQYQIGEELPILYNPDQPGNARIYSTGELWGLPAGLGIAGIIVTLVSLGLLRGKQG